MRTASELSKFRMDGRSVGHAVEPWVSQGDCPGSHKDTFAIVRFVDSEVGFLSDFMVENSAPSGLR